VLEREEIKERRPHSHFYDCLDFLKEKSMNHDSLQHPPHLQEPFLHKNYEYGHPFSEKLIKSVRSQFTFLFFCEVMVRHQLDRFMIWAPYQATDLARTRSWLKLFSYKVLELWHQPYTEGICQIAPFDREATQRGLEEQKWLSNRYQELTEAAA
jgi:hypothetical protein